MTMTNGTSYLRLIGSCSTLHGHRILIELLLRGICPVRSKARLLQIHRHYILLLVVLLYWWKRKLRLRNFVAVSSRCFLRLVLSEIPWIQRICAWRYLTLIMLESKRVWSIDRFHIVGCSMEWASYSCIALVSSSDKRHMLLVHKRFLLRDCIFWVSIEQLVNVIILRWATLKFDSRLLSC